MLSAFLAAAHCGARYRLATFVALATFATTTTTATSTATATLDAIDVGFDRGNVSFSLLQAF